MTHRSRFPFGSVPRLWPSETVVCLASGPSLCHEDAEYVRGKARVIVINTTWTLAPWADCLFACDGKWWRGQKGATATFGGLKFSLQREAAQYGATVLQNTGMEGLEAKPTGLRSGRNSGYMAINLAVHLGAQRILLLGYDMQRSADGREHWHQDHPNRSRSPYPMFLKRFDSIVAPLRALGIEAVNCTRQTALTCFPQVPLREAI